MAESSPVDLSYVPEIRPLYQSNYVLTSTFGNLGSSLKNYVQDYQSCSLVQPPSSTNSITDMNLRFVEKYPQFWKQVGG